MKSKILIAHEKCGFFGGAEQHLFSTADKLKEHYHLCLLSSESTGKREREFLAPFQTARSIAGWEKDRILAALEEVRPDLIFIHKCRSSEAMRLLVEHGVPTVHMVHDHEEYCFKKSKYFPLTRQPCTSKSGMCCLFPGLGFIERSPSGIPSLKFSGFLDQRRLIAQSKKCSAFLVASRYMKKTLEIQGYERIRLLFGVPLITPHLPVRKKRSPETVAYIGQIIRGKGLDHLIQAMQAVQHPWKLVVIGSGAYEDHCKSLAEKLGIAHQIDFKGFVPREEMDSILSDAAVGVVPSLWPEPFGMAGVEFLQNGIPVVGYDSGGISDWLINDQTGKMIPAGRTDLLGSAIEEILRDPVKGERLGNQGRDFVHERYDFDKYIKGLGALFEEMMG